MHSAQMRRHRTQQLRPQSGDVAELLKPRERIRPGKRQVSFQPAEPQCYSRSLTGRLDLSSAA
jgi:hypothetical protein